MSLFKSLKQALQATHEVRALKIKVSEPKLPFALQAFPNLEELYLDAPFLVELPDDLSGLHQLRVLEMVAPKMRKNLSELFHLPRLQILKLTDTPLSPLQLGLSFSFAPLRFLTLKNAGLKELPLEFAELKTLEELNLSHNQLQQLPMNFFELTRLKRINLDSNRFQLFPQILAQTPSLKHVSLDHNQFSETERERIQRQFHLTVI